MKTSDKGLALIKSFEGFSAKPYLCPAGVPTIGYGATYYPDGRRVTMQDKPVSEADATDMLRSMLASYEAGVSRYVLVPVTQGQFDALVSFAYNVGLSALKDSTLLRLVNLRVLVTFTAAVSLSLSGGAFAIEHYGLHSYSTTAQGFVMFLFAVLGLLLLGVVYRSIELLRGKRLSEIVGELGAAYAAIVRGFKS